MVNDKRILFLEAGGTALTGVVKGNKTEMRKKQRGGKVLN